jgi:hypothetical protein
MTNAVFPSGTQTWSYNTLQQLIGAAVQSGSTYRMSMAYNYTTGRDNGQIATSADTVTGETITYQCAAYRIRRTRHSTMAESRARTTWKEGKETIPIDRKSTRAGAADFSTVRYACTSAWS